MRNEADKMECIPCKMSKLCNFKINLLQYDMLNIMIPVILFIYELLCNIKTTT